MNGKVLFICGGKWQLPWMRYLKNKGHQIVLVDPNKNPPCATLADIHIQCDARDVDSTCLQVHDSKDVERDQSVPCPHLDRVGSKNCVALKAL